jgi:hypothetical protein
MRILQPAAALLVCTALAAPQIVMAQDAYMNLNRPSPALHSGTMPPAVSDPAKADKTLDAPVAGKNSFTRNEAQKRLERHGYTNVNSLQKDDKSIWHANAQKDGRDLTVTLDYQGNITEGRVTHGNTSDQ